MRAQTQPAANDELAIGIIGLGTIGRALAQGFQRSPRVRRIMATTRRPRASYSDQPEVIAVGDNRELASRCDVVTLAVKPHQMESILRDISDSLREGALLVSVAAGIPTSAIAEWSGGRFAVVRAMPNMPCHISAGITALAPGAGATDEHLDLVRELFEGLGRVVIVEESLMNAVTALSGCGPAFVYMIIEALTDAGVSLGLPRTVSLELAAQTLQGSAALVLASGKHPAALKDDVTTPAGCTIDGILALEEGRLRSTLARAVAAAASRASKLTAKE